MNESQQQVESVSEPISGTPAKVNRVDLWKRKLLDLSKRNRLLNFRETKGAKGAIAILSPNPEHVEDELADGEKLILSCKPKDFDESDSLFSSDYTQQQKEYLYDKLNRHILHTNLKESEHNRRLIEISRASRLAVDETGVNTLFITIGILEWHEPKDIERLFRAPLLLVPVELKRNLVDGFVLRRVDEETRLNVTLMEML
jgi:hypothetical protein